jgi:hypothetical protein
MPTAHCERESWTFTALDTKQVTKQWNKLLEPRKMRGKTTPEFQCLIPHLEAEGRMVQFILQKLFFFFNYSNLKLL